MTTSVAIPPPRPSKAGQAHLHVVSFRLGAETYAVELSRTKEICLADDITQVLFMPSYVDGVINLRGQILPIIDLRKRFNVGVATFNLDTHILVAHVAGSLIGLVVDTVSTILRIPSEALLPPPETSISVIGAPTAGVAHTDDGLLLLLDIDHILSVDEQAQISKVNFN